jgi:hypothetical protein
MLQPFNAAVPILWGDNLHDDSAVLRILFNGGAAFDVRTAQMIAAPSIEHLPPGCYRTSEKQPAVTVNTHYA